MKKHNSYNRIELVQEIFRKTNFKTYLEIGTLNMNIGTYLVWFKTITLVFAPALKGVSLLHTYLQ